MKMKHSPLKICYGRVYRLNFLLVFACTVLPLTRLASLLFFDVFCKWILWKIKYYILYSILFLLQVQCFFLRGFSRTEEMLRNFMPVQHVEIERAAHSFSGKMKSCLR